MSDKFYDILNNFVKELVENYSGDELIKEIVVSPYLFRQIERDYHTIHRSYNEITCPKQATLFTQMGKVIVKKDLSSVIKQKEDAIKNLQMELEQLRSE